MKIKFSKKLFDFLKSELFFFLFISFLLLGISISTQVKRQLDTPKDRVFSGLEFYSDDYSIYVSNIFQGQRGRWTLLDKHTSEPHEGTIIHDEYLLWGKYTNLFRVDAITSYHLARYTFGFILLGMVYLFLKEIFSDQLSIDHRLSSARLRKLAFSIVTFATGFVIIKNDINGLNFDFHMIWLTEMDNFFRFVALPHYLLGNIFFLGALIAFLKYVKLANSQQPTANSYLFWGAFCSLMLALIHPVALVSLMALLGIYLLFMNIIKLVTSGKFLIFNFTCPSLPCRQAGGRREFLISGENIFFLTCLLISAPVMLFYRSQFAVTPWNHMAAWEGVTQYYVPLKEFALAIGPTFFLGILGFFGMLLTLQAKSNDQRPMTNDTSANSQKLIARSNLSVIIILLSWIISFFLLIYFSYPYLHISQVRFMQVFIFIPFGVFAAYGIFFLNDVSKKIIGGIGKYLILVVLVIIIAIALPYYYASMELKYRFFTDFSPLIYPYRETVEGYRWLRDNTSAERIVLGAFLAGTQIPYFSNNTVYVGHLWATLNRQEKETLQNKFLNNQMGVEEAKEFFKRNNISYFFQGFQEKTYPVQPQNYPFLKPVYQNPSTTIYEAIF